MVSQSQDSVGWGEGNSRAGSLLSLDGRQAPAKTPPSYYDAVRSRHSLSQPRPSEGGGRPKTDKGQQVKYNSLPRPLPQRYPPTSTNGQQHRPWPDDHYDPVRPNSNPPWRPGDLHTPRQVYDSPPKPANHVPLQLQVHNQETRYLVKRGPEQTESCSAPGPGEPRGSDQARMNGGPRADRLTVDCNARGNSMDMSRKDSHRSLPPCPDVRSPPAVPLGGRPMHPKSPPLKEPNMNSLPRRDSNHSSGLLRRCYTATAEGSPKIQPNYTARSPMNGNGCYEPRYSKSGKLSSRPLSQGFETRPMPPPAVQLRTGPLGSYPDPETLKRSEMASYNNRNDFDKQAHRTTPTHGDISQQIYVDTNTFPNGQSVITDHLAIPYRIPQVSPKNSRSLFDGCNGLDKRKEPPSGITSFAQPSPSTNGFKPTKSQQLLTCVRPLEDHSNSLDHRARRHHDSGSTSHSNNVQTFENPHASFYNYSKHPPSPGNRNPSHMNDDDAIYANHQISVHSSSGQNHPSLDYRSTQKRSPRMPSGSGMHFDKQPLKSSYSRDITDISTDDAVYANQHIASARYMSSPHGSQQDDIHSPSNFQIDRESTLSNFGNIQKNNYASPPVAQKPRSTLPQPLEMVMITETRGWNGQVVNSCRQDVVKPTPRLPHFANVASGTQLTSVPAYQCVINELSTQNVQQAFPRSSDSSTLSLRSGYDSSSSSVRDYGRQPSKSDSSIDMRKLSEGGLKAASSQQGIDKTFLSASMTSLCSDASSSVSSRRYRHHPEDPNWDRMNEEFQKRKDKGSVFSASPWEREEKEKLQREQLVDARRARDQEIAFLESVQDRSEKQEEWLRILRLEREFQRRAEQEMREDEDEEEEEDDETQKMPEEKDEKVETFHGDKVNVIPSERLGLKLLDELLENPSTSPSLENREFSKSPSENHFIPLELTIPDRDLPHSSSLPPGSNILQVSDQKSGTSRLAKPPIPAPRPSKACIASKIEVGACDVGYNDSEGDIINQNISDNKTADLSMRSLAKLDISDASLYYNDGSNIGRNYLQDNWLIEVNSFESRSNTDKMVTKQNGDQKEESRIYENIMEFQGPKTQSSSQNGFGSHTLPKATGNMVTKEILSTRSGSSHLEKKFPAMGVSSTLSRKMNGHVPCDSDILPCLYASSKLKNSYQKDIPSDLEDKSPEFKKLWVSRPEKLTFQDKIRKFSLQAGEDDVPRDRVKNSRAQREIETKFQEGQRKLSSNSEI